MKCQSQHPWRFLLRARSREYHHVANKWLWRISLVDSSTWTVRRSLAHSPNHAVEYDKTPNFHEHMPGWNMWNAKGHEKRCHVQCLFPMLRFKSEIMESITQKCGNCATNNMQNKASLAFSKKVEKLPEVKFLTKNVASTHFAMHELSRPAHPHLWHHMLLAYFP